MKKIVGATLLRNTEGSEPFLMLSYDEDHCQAVLVYKDNTVEVAEEFCPSDYQTLATGVNPDSKSFYRIAYAFGLPVQKRTSRVQLGNGEDFMHFGQSVSASELSIPYESVTSLERAETIQSIACLEQDLEKLRAKLKLPVED